MKISQPRFRGNRPPRGAMPAFAPDAAGDAARRNGNGIPASDWLRGGPARLLVVSGFALVVLAGCGGGGAPAPDQSGSTGQSVATTPPEATTQVIVLASPPASPISGQLPAATPAAANRGIQVETFDATIANGTLTPDQIEGEVGASYALRITGDGAEHEIAIEGLTNPETVAASGTTDVQFTVSENPGDFRIMIDGKQAGVFTANSPSGMSGLTGSP